MTSRRFWRLCRYCCFWRRCSRCRCGADGREWLPELLDFTPYVRWWEAPLRLLLVCALCWGWLCEGSVFQIALALLLWFCIGWALCLLLRPRRARMTP